MITNEVKFNGQDTVEQSVVYNILPENIFFDPEHNGRNATPDLKDLESSIKEYGIIQPLIAKVSDGKAIVRKVITIEKQEQPKVDAEGKPVMDKTGKAQVVEEVDVEVESEEVVEVPPAGTVVLVAGYSRVQAALNIKEEYLAKGKELTSLSGADLNTVPVIFVGDVDSKGTLLLNIEENVRRNNLSPMDVYANIVRLRDEHGIGDWKELTKIFGRSRAWVEQHMKLGENLAPKIQRKVHSGEIPWSVAQKLVDLEKPAQEELLEHLKEVGEPITRDNVVKAKRDSAEEKPKAEPSKYESRTAKVVKDYFIALRETEKENDSVESKRGSKITFLCDILVDFIDGKLTDRQMDNRINKYVTL